MADHCYLAVDLGAESGRVIAGLFDGKRGALKELHRFYGESLGVRVARKHLTWYSKQLVNAGEFRYQVVRVNSAQEQLRLTKEYFAREDGGISLAA